MLANFQIPRPQRAFTRHVPSETGVTCRWREPAQFLNPRYSISILGFNRLDLTKKCVESVLQNSCNYELLLWDNGSKDGTGEYFKTVHDLYPNSVFYHCERTNSGFIQPNRRQLSKARGQYFILLNNDTEVPPGWLQALEQPFLVHKDAALVGVEGTCSHLDHRPGRELCLIGEPGVFEYVEGSCLMGRTDLLKRHELFAPYLDFAYCEDADLSLRMRYLGYSIHQVPLTLKHVRSATSQSVPGIRKVMAKNMDTMERVWSHYLRIRRTDHAILIRRKHAIGDVLLTTPIIRALHEAKPRCPILVETDFPDIFERNPCVTQAAKRIIPPQNCQIIELNYENETEAHYVEAYARCAGISLESKQLEMHPGTQDIAEAGRLLVRVGRWATIHAGATTWPGRNWPIESMRQIADWLLKRGWNIALLNQHRDPSYAIPCTLDLRGKLSLQQMAAVQKYCSLFVGQDSLPLHVAQAMGVPAVGIFGATLPQYVMTDGSPWKAVCADPSIPCAGERHRVKGAVYVPCNGECIRSVRTEDIKKAIEELV